LFIALQILPFKDSDPFRKDDRNETPFQDACMGFEYKVVLKVIEETLVVDHSDD
jgi:hypothetical protein